MKKSILSLAIFAIALINSADVVAQKFPKLDVSPMDAASFPTNWRDANKLVKVVYSRPQLKGRDLEKLAPKDKVWRLGANESAEITFYKDVIFGGKKVKAGTYSMYAIPTDGDWTIILSNQINYWGSYFYKQDQDVVRVSGKISKPDNEIEAFSIVFEGEGTTAEMHLGWANTVVTVPVTAQETNN
ncbi:DUF2911 domain-containing protein [Polaribacter aestuariivivens]|uniref:DUF2911 domain-containing protein n=1 Tax=Polaribacter aestuariivivens TaxID=2304626 RepID=UPI003F499626